MQKLLEALVVFLAVLNDGTAEKASLSSEEGTREMEPPHSYQSGAIPGCPISSRAMLILLRLS